MAKDYKQGIYKPQNPQKYKGTKDPVYRSGYELKFMCWADNHPNVVHWGSECIIIPYISPIDGKMHRYFVDNFVRLKVGNETKTFLVEIKPKDQTKAPILEGRKQKTKIYETARWAVNQAKWEAAKAWAKKKGWEFTILTEKELGI